MELESEAADPETTIPAPLRRLRRFRAPTLRNIAVTAPYMHDGSNPTLEGVLDHYASGGHRSRFRSRAVRGFRLTGAERADLLAFRDSLTDRAFLANPAFARPR